MRPDSCHRSSPLAHVDDAGDGEDGEDEEDEENDEEEDDDDGESVSVAIIGGIVAACVLAIAAILGCVYFHRR